MDETARVDADACTLRIVTGFKRAVEEAQAWLPTAFGEAYSELGGAMERASTREQAESVDDCVRRFSRAELEGKKVGRYGPVKFFPALGDHQAKKLRDADDTQRQRVRDGIAFGVAIGYTFMAGIEDDGEPHPDRNSGDIWNVWIPNLNSGLIERTALPADMLSALRAMGASAFQERALQLGLGGFGKKSRIGHSGAFYSQAGALLRAIQAHPEDLNPDPANIWPYSEYPA